MQPGELRSKIMDLLQDLGIDPTESNYSQFYVFMQALKLHSDRTRVYGQAWGKYGALANLLNAARKAERMMEVWWRREGEPVDFHKEKTDDAYDLINYVGFFLRCHADGNMKGN